MTLILQSCDGQTIHTFKEVTLGGKDMHGKLYQKRYFSEEDTNIKYSTWKGVEVSTNEEIVELLKVNPSCQAILIKRESLDNKDSLELTEKIGEFKNLKYLEIYNHGWIKYPKSMEKLTSLEELIILLGQKQEIEISFSNFKNLKHLTIHFAGYLKMFPPSIFDCKNLETLKLFRFFDIENNTLHGIENLKNLRELYIWDSTLTLPDDVEYQYTQLETFIIDGIQQKLPEYFFHSNSIKRLGLSRSIDTLDFDVISKMENLECLTLDSSNESIGNLSAPKLEHLNITNYRGSEINIDFKKLTSLESLIVWGCDNLEKISTISGSKLKSFEMVNNDRLTSISFDESNLQDIEKIMMRSNDTLLNRPTTINGVGVSER